MHLQGQNNIGYDDEKENKVFERQNFKTLRRVRRFSVDGEDYTTSTEVVIDVNKGKNVEQQGQRLLQAQRYETSVYVWVGANQSGTFSVLVHFVTSVELYSVTMLPDVHSESNSFMRLYGK